MHRSPFQFAWMLAAVVLIVLASVDVAAGQSSQSQDEPAAAQAEPPNQSGEDQSGEADQPDQDEAEESPLLEEIQRRRRDLEAAESLNDEQKAALELLEQAESHLQQSAESAAAADQYAEKADTAAQQLAQVQTQYEQATAEQPPPDLSEVETSQLDVMLEDARQRLQKIRQQRSDLEAEATRRNERLARIPTEIQEAQQRLEQINDILDGAANGVNDADVDVDADVAAEGDDDAASERAQELSLLAERAYLRARIEELQQELRSYEARRDLLRARTRLAEREVVNAEQRVKQVEEAINLRLIQRSRDVVQAAESRLRDAKDAHPVIPEIYQQNIDLARTLQEVTTLSRTLSKQRQQLEQLLARWRTSFSTIKERVEASGLTQPIGQRLRTQREQLPDLRELHIEQRRLQNLINQILLRKAELEEQQLRLEDIESEVDVLLRDAELPASQEEREQLRQQIREVLQDQNETFIEPLIQTYDRFLNDTLDPLERSYRRLIDLTEEYRAFIDERILWIRSAAPISADDFQRAADAAWYLTSPSRWRAVGVALVADLRKPVTVLTLLVVVGLLLLYPGMLRRLEQLEPRPRAFPPEGVGKTFAAMLVTIVLTITIPLIIVVLAWRLRVIGEQPDNPVPFASVLGVAFGRVAIVLLAAEFVRQLVRPHGLGDRHFEWRQGNLRLVRRNLRWFVPVIAVLAFVIAVFEIQPTDDYANSLGRFSFIVAMLALSVFTYRLLKPSSGLLQEQIASLRGGWVDKLTVIWFPLLAAVPIVLAVAAALGYFYTALQLERRLIASTWLIILIVVGYYLLLRWLTVTQRRIAIEQARKKRQAMIEARAAEQAAAAAAQDGEHTTAAAGGSTEELPTEQIPADRELLDEVDVASMSSQTRRLLRMLLAASIVIGLLIVWADVFPAFAVLDRVELWSDTQTVSTDGTDVVVQDVITLGDLSRSLIILILTFLISRNIPGMLEIFVLQRLPFTPGGRYAISTVARYALVIIGIVLAFNAVGIGWSKVQFLAAAITVGLGFGLQEIFANFVSGLIILFERPIRVGDTVTVSGVSGTVSRIRMRATTVTDWDRKELIIPNKEFVTGQVINWSLSDPMLRITVPVGIAYGSDTDLARTLLLQAAQDNASVLDDPPPRALFLGFGDSSLNFELRVFIPSIDYFLSVKHELHHEIDQIFRRNKVEIAFPQRDLHLRSISETAEKAFHPASDNNAPPA